METSFIINNGEENNWLNILQNPIYYSALEKHNALNYACSNIMDMTKNGDVFKLGLEAFIELAKCDDLNLESEIKVFELVKGWVDHSTFNSHDILPKLIQVVRLVYIPLENLIETVLPYIWNIDGCRPFFEEAILWKFAKKRKVSNERTRPREFQKNIANKSSAPKKTKIPSKEIDLRNQSDPSDPHGESETVESNFPKKLLAISSSIVEIYHADENRWQRLKDIYLKKERYAAAFMDDRLIVSGGIDSVDVNTVEEIDLSTGGVTTLAPMLECRFDHRMIAAKNGNDWSLYAIGGRESGSNGKQTIEKYNPETNTWTYLASMISPRYGFGAVLHGDDIYVIGGYGTEFKKELEIYHINQDSWEQKSSMQQPRIFNNAVISGSTLYIIAGHSWDHDENSRLNSVETYNIDSGIWYQTLGLYTSGWVGASLLNNTPIVVGGWNKNTVEVFDKKRERWGPLTPMTVARDMVNLLPLPSIFDNYDFNW